MNYILVLVGITSVIVMIVIMVYLDSRFQQAASQVSPTEPTKLQEQKRSLVVEANADGQLSVRWDPPYNMGPTAKLLATIEEGPILNRLQSRNVAEQILANQGEEGASSARSILAERDTKASG